MLPRTYTRSYSVDKGRQFLQKNIYSCIRQIIWNIYYGFNKWHANYKYWHNLGAFLDKAKEKIHEQFRIGDTCFTSLETIGGNLFARHPKNLNHVHKYSNNILSVIIILGTYFCGGKKVFLNGMTMNYIGKRAHALKHSYGRCVVGYSDKISHEGYI